jgi:hypothetical protein
MTLAVLWALLGFGIGYCFRAILSTFDPEADWNRGYDSGWNMRGEIERIGPEWRKDKRN